MSEREIWAAPFGQMNDLIACYLIRKGLAKATDCVDGADDEEMIPDIP